MNRAPTMEIAYPSSLENFWVQHTLRELGINALEEKQHLLEQHIQRLSDAFTKERNSLTKDYFNDPLAICTYGLFYFPQTYVRTLFAFRDLLMRGWRPPERCSILDLGAGMGAASLAIAAQIPGSPITAVDRSESSLSILKEAASIQRQTVEIHVDDAIHFCSTNRKRFDFIVASFSLSEMNVSSVEWTSVFGSMLTPQGIVLILEPSLQSTAEWLEQWRDQLSDANEFHIWAPCLHRQKCPLLQSGKYWCHEVRSWDPPQSLQFVNRRLYREVHITRFSFLAFGKAPPLQFPGLSMRMISPLSKQKRDYLLTGCANDGKAHSFRISGRNLRVENRRLIRKLERGDILVEEEKGILILESGLVFVVKNRSSDHHEVRNE